MKPQKYTLPDHHTAYVFTMVKKRNVAILCNWGERVLKDLIRARIGSNYQTKRYIGCGHVITRIVYHAFGMIDNLVELADEEHVFWEIHDRKEEAQRGTRGKHKVVMEDQSSSDEEEEALASKPPPTSDLAPAPALALAPFSQGKRKINIKVKMRAPNKDKVPLEYKDDEEE